MALEKGLSITIRGFIAVDPHDLEAHRNALDATVKAKAGDLAALNAEGIGFRIDEFSAAPIARRPKE